MSARFRRACRPLLEILEGRCQPSTFTVTNLKDDFSAGSLRQRINDANMHSGADTVVFAPGLEGTIQTNGAHIPIFDNLTLIGPGAGKVAVAGKGNDSVFLVDNGAGGADLTVRMQGLEVRGGSSGAGGAIFTHENLTLVGMVLDNNRAYKGGAVYATGDLTLVGCTLSGNEADTGGAGVRFNGHALTIDRSTISGNTATLYGGGLYLDAGTAVLRDSVVSGNTSTVSSGGLYVDTTVTDLAIEGTRIVGNRATGPSSYGGGLTSYAARTTITNSTIASNSAGSDGGGGLFSRGEVVIDHSVISNNTTTGSGGGIYQFDDSLSLTASTVSGNRAGGAGGGVYTQAASSSFTNTQITDNTAASSGGGLLSTGATIVDHSTVSGNTSEAGRGGGIRQRDQGAGFLNLLSSTVSGNHADKSQGGGVAITDTSGGTLLFGEMLGSTISGNSAGAGGGLFVDTAPLQMRNCTVSGNRAAGDGGGILGSASAMEVQNCTVVLNRAGASGTGAGGGISSSGATIILRSSIVALNSDAGGHPDLDSSTTAFTAGFNFIGNKDGAAMFNDDGTSLAGTTGSEFDPLLAPLAFNGGPTQTHRLKAGSPCINRGANFAALAFDQRGAPFKRKLGGAVDIGAYERQ